MDNLDFNYNVNIFFIIKMHFILYLLLNKLQIIYNKKNFIFNHLLYFSIFNNR